MKTINTLILSLGFCLYIQAQEIKVAGEVKDSLNTLANANILAIPSTDDVSDSAISIQKGKIPFFLYLIDKTFLIRFFFF